MIGKTVSHFMIQEKLGEGAMGQVYLAEDTDLNRRVALKFIPPSSDMDSESGIRLLQEARIAASISHPNVVSIYGLRIEESLFYIVMEYLSQGNLKDLVNKQTKLPVEKAVRLAIGICEGLTRLHEKGIIHRDIKAENILLTADGRPKIIDFGIAHVPEVFGGMGLTQAGFQPSTVVFSSPEQVRGEPLDARSDVR